MESPTSQHKLTRLTPIRKTGNNAANRRPRPSVSAMGGSKDLLKTRNTTVPLPEHPKHTALHSNSETAISLSHRNPAANSRLHQVRFLSSLPLSSPCNWILLLWPPTLNLSKLNQIGRLHKDKISRPGSKPPVCPFLKHTKQATAFSN